MGKGSRLAWSPRREDPSQPCEPGRWEGRVPYFASLVVLGRQEQQAVQEAGRPGTTGWLPHSLCCVRASPSQGSTRIHPLHVVRCRVPRFLAGDLSTRLPAFPGLGQGSREQGRGCPTPASRERLVTELGQRSRDRMLQVLFSKKI